MAGVNQSGIYIDQVIGNLRPKVVCMQIDPNAVLGPQSWNIVLPSGHSDVEQLAGSCPAISIEPSGFINFGSGVNVHTSQWTSRTAAFIFMPKWDDGQQVSTDITLFNMKLWMDNTTAFSGLRASGLNPYIQMLPSGEWVRNLVLPSGAYGAFEVPSGLPDTPNISRIDGVPWLSGVGFERTQIIYSSIILPEGTYPVGRYGGLGLTDLHWRFTYDWASEFSHIHIGTGSGTHTDY